MRLLVLLLGTALFASSCSGEPPSQHQLQGQQQWVSGINPGVDRTRGGNGSGPDAERTRGNTPGERFDPPASPSRFRVTLRLGPCFGSCPMVEVAVDERGTVEYAGERHVGRPGVFTKQVSPINARILYDALVAARYFELEERYIDEETCPGFEHDEATASWSIEVDGKIKRVAYYHGCEGVRSLATLKPLEGLTFRLTETSAWISGDSSPGFSSTEAAIGEAYRVAVDGKPIGVLSFGYDDQQEAEPYRTYWVLVDCRGVRVAEGAPAKRTTPSILIAGEYVYDDPNAVGPGIFGHFDAYKFALPGVGEVGSLFLDYVGDSKDGSKETLRLRALRAEDEATLSVTPGDRC